ncbi:MAG TPA: 16S rRNA (cytosine(1402)-N(4))-methyltransferase RsmH [Bacteroidales bacterium]
MTTYHTPVLLCESIKGLNIQPGGVYVDVTFGGGGHSREILNHLKGGKLVAFDQDPDAMNNKIDHPGFILCNGNFKFLKNFLKYHGITHINGLLADLGVSSHHFDTVERGFTFQGDSLLDMRMNPLASITASEILNQYSGDQLRHIFKDYGEVENAHRLASVIVSRREAHPFSGSEQFIEAIKTCIPRGNENKYLAKVYQALRIEVNRELESLKSMLTQCNEVMLAGGRLVIITYHSLEDRIVKNFIKTGNFEGNAEKDFYGNVTAPFKAVNNKVIVATEEEVKSNNRARSAKLRIAEKVK